MPKLLPSTWSMILLAGVVTRADASASFAQPDARAFPDVFVWADTANVYVLRDGAAAVLIDLGDGSVLDRLGDIAVQRVEWVLFTHHHREQCQGAPRLKGTATKVAAPKGERELFGGASSYRRMTVRLNDPLTIHGTSFVRPAIRPIPIDRSLEPGETFRWRKHEIQCLATPGDSPAAMTYVVELGGRKLAFSGDVMLDGATMHTWYDAEWDYGFGAGVRALRKSVGTLVEAKHDMMLPSHGPVIRDPAAQLETYAQKLERLEKLHARGYGVEAASNAYQDKVSKPTPIEDLAQVSPHLFKLKRASFWPNFNLILSDSGRALLVDCGLLDPEFLDETLEGMKEIHGLEAIDAVVVTHMHGDHFLQAPHVRDKWGAQIWALDNMVEKMEHPERFDYPAPIQAYGSGVDRVEVDRAFKPGESFDWEGHRFTIDWMPGQTEFALCMHGVIDGKRVAFTGDNIFGDPDDPTQTGHEAVVARNSAILEEGYIHGAELLARLRPDVIVGGHSFVMGNPAGLIERFRKWSYEMRDAFRALSPDPDYRYWFDPYWVRAHPYRTPLEPGETKEVLLHVRNFRKAAQKHRVELCAPPGVAVEPPVVEGELSAGSRGVFAVRVTAAPDAGHGTHVVALDVTLDGKRYGQRFDFIVGIDTREARAPAGEVARPGDLLEEADGPFASWKDVKTDYGAVGDGKADDTRAIQKALTDLQSHEDFCVLHVPAGTYRITDTVRTVRKAHHDGMGMALVGEDPATTVLRWDGPEGGTMVQYDAWYSKIGRLTLDGAGKAENALAYGDAFSTYNETSDMVFRDVKWGMTLATAREGQAENGVLRCRFLRCSEGGLRTVNFNSMDIWIWDSVFEDCGYGVFNAAGNFHVYHSLFLRSRKTDIGSANLMAFSFVDNVSIGSRSFLDWSGHSWGSPTTISGNRIVEYTGDYAIQLANFGPYLMLDNQIRSRPGETRPPIRLTWGDQSLVGNVCTVPNPVQPAMQDGNVASRFLEIGTRVVEPEEIDATPPALPATPRLVRRHVFEVPASADAAAIQAAVDRAAAKKGERPVVHLPKGTYAIQATLVVPAGCDLRLVGDGAAETATVLRWEGPAGGALLRLAGPSRATVRDLSISAGAGIGILVEDADQEGGRVFGDMVNTIGGQGLFVNGLGKTRVLLRNHQGGECHASWIRVAGGGPDAPPVTVLCGATGTSRRQYDVEKGGRLVVRGVYHEVSGDAPEAILLDGEGSLAVDATRFSYKASPEHPTVALEGFRGEFLVTSAMLLGVTEMPAWFRIRGDGGACRCLCLGNQFWLNQKGLSAGDLWSDASRPPAKAALRLCNANSGIEGETKRLDDLGESSDEFAARMLRPLREARIWHPGEPAPAGATGVVLHRVILGAAAGGTGLELRAGAKP